MNSWLQQQVKTRANQPALYWDQECWTFAEVGEEVQRWVTVLEREIPQTEHRVALFSQNSTEMYFVILALWELGKEIVFLNTRLSSPELAYQLNDAAVRSIISDPSFQHRLLSINDIHSIPMVCTAKKEQVTQSNNKRYQPNEVASIMYTSGTTGNPKGVVQRFTNHKASALATQENMHVTPNDCWLCTVPLFHISGLSIIIRQLVVGCSVRLYAHFNALQLTDDLAKGNGTIASVVTVMLKELLNTYPKKGYSSKFRGFLLGGGPVSIDILEKCHALTIPVIQSYGMTETCSQVVALQFKDAKRKIGSAGKPLSGIQVRIVDPMGKALPRNQVGELWLKGENIVSTYLHAPVGQPSKWTAEGWFKTGDMGYLDEEGYLYLVSRLSELIISGGENIYPTEIEQVIARMPEVCEVAIVGEMDEHWGAVPVAYIVANVALTKEQIEAFSSPYLATFKLPKRVYFCERLPRTASGKVAKHRLTTNERKSFLRHEHS